MQIAIRKESQVMVVELLEKRLEARVAEDFKRELTRFVEAGNNQVVLDLSNVDFVDSSGLNAIVFGLKLVGQGGNLALSGVKHTIMGIFSLTRINKVFKIFDNEKDAIKALAT